MARMLCMVTTEGNWNRPSVISKKIDQVNTTAQLSESEALQHAMKHIGAELYKWQIPEEERWIKEYLNDTYYPQGEMVIVKDILQGSNQYRLADKFDIYAHKPLSRYMVCICGCHRRENFG